MSIRKTTIIPTGSLTLKRGEHMTLVTFLKKGWHHKKMFTVQLAGVDSSFAWFLCVLGSDNQNFSFDFHINHSAPRTTSRVYVRGVLEHQSMMRCLGRSTIGPRARSADTYVALHTLLLTPDAHSYAVPSLEILNPDVKAGHAASVDRFLANDLFYLQTRGIDEKKARTFLTKGFLSSDLHHLSDDRARTAMTRQIARTAGE